MTLRWTTLLVLVLAFGLGGCKTEQDRRDEHLARADTYLSEGKVKEAMLELRNALQRDPQNADINLELARILERTERVADAFFFYEEAHRLDPESAEAALGIARLGAFDDPERATTVVEELLAREPGNASAHVQRSQIYLIDRDLEGALTSAFTALELAPNEAMVHFQVGRVHQARLMSVRAIENGEPEAEIYESAIAAFDRAVELGGPDQKLNAMLERARVFATWPEHGDAALQAYRDLVAESVALERVDFQVKSASATVAYAREIDDEEFLRWALEQQIAAQPGRLQAWRELAELAEAETPGAGAAVLAPLLEEHSESALIHLLYAGFLDAQSQTEASLEHLRSALETVEKPEEILGALVSMYLASGDPEAAETIFAQLKEQHPASPETRLASAEIALKDGRVEDAVDTLTLLGTSTEDPEVYRLLAHAELRAGRVVQATAAIDRARELAGQPSLAILQMDARVAHASGAWRRVIAAFNEIQARGHDLRAREYMMSARAYFGMGRNAKGLSILGDLALLERPYVPAVVEFANRAPPRAAKFVRERLDAALEQNPGDARLLSAYAILDARDGKDAQALARLDQALAAGPNARAFAIRARVRGRLGDNEGAIEDALLAFQMQPTSGNARALAATYEMAGRLDEAVSSFEEAAEVGALPVDALPVLARLQLANENTGAAIATFEKVLEQRPGATGVKNDLAFLLAEEGADLDRALTLAQEAQSEAPDLAPVADTLGYVYLKRQMFEPAERQFRYAIELEGTRGESAGYRYHLALVLGQQGRHAEAIEALEAALAAEEEFADAEAARRELEAARAALEEVASS